MKKHARFTSLLPLISYCILGDSMLPDFPNGTRVLGYRYFFTLKIDDIVILTDPRTSRLLMKRIKKIDRELFYVIGDNSAKSTDSRHFGWVSKKQIIAKVIVRRK